MFFHRRLPKHKTCMWPTRFLLPTLWTLSRVIQERNSWSVLNCRAWIRFFLSVFAKTLEWSGFFKSLSPAFPHRLKPMNQALSNICSNFPLGQTIAASCSLWTMTYIFNHDLILFSLGSLPWTLRGGAHLIIHDIPMEDLIYTWFCTGFR